MTFGINTSVADPTRQSLCPSRGRRSKRQFAVGLLIVVTAAFDQPASGQSFTLEAYDQFLGRTEAATYTQLAADYPSGAFARAATGQFDDALYADTVKALYGITAYEEQLLDRHGFMVTERNHPESFGEALYAVYREDLPVYISSDALLHAWHKSYDAILMETELAVLYDRLNELLTFLRDALPTYVATLPAEERLQRAAADVDVYLSVASGLLTGSVAAVDADNQATVDELTALVYNEAPGQYNLFAESCRIIDFSQFKPRSHYADWEALKKYFRAMIWLGRTELYLIGPETAICAPTAEDVQRQTLMSLMLVDLMKTEVSRQLYDGIDRPLAAFVGEQDNTTLDLLISLADSTGIAAAPDYLEPGRAEAFTEALAASPFSRQRINSQILYTDDVRDVDKVEPAAAFMLFGQRFTVDSYVMGHVVYSEVRAKRMLPSTADVLFALGNDAALHVVAEEIERFDYGPQLAALRYLIDGFDDAFWESTLYNGWLQSIRTLNPKRNRESLPAFMQTAAWTQKQMSTQLAGWAQMRHDNLLYAKQSYSGGITCLYPYVLVEPVPDFFAAMARLASRGGELFAELASQGDLPAWLEQKTLTYFPEFATTATKLSEMAQRHVDGLPLTEEQLAFAQTMINWEGGSGATFDGWYPRLFFSHTDDVLAEDLVVADVHTAPTDASGNPVGWVMHAGTGPVNLAVVTADVPGVGPVAFTGPVMSYYEHVSVNYTRLTDQDWETVWAMEPSARPDFARLYLASEEGESMGAGFVMPTGVVDDEAVTTSETSIFNYPNPFSDATRLSFSIPRGEAHRLTHIEIFDVSGRIVSSATLPPAPAGTYTWIWRPDALPSGVYLARVRTGEATATAKVTLLR